MDTHETDRHYMRRALELAELGRGCVSPNPMVGAVIAAPDGRIIGEGWHRRYGGPHAEVNAVASVRPADIRLLPQSTIYVTLEPCAHYGKTPPCAAMLIEKGLGHVVIGARDPFDKVCGRGIAMLREAGIDVRTGALEDECRALNASFFTAHTLRRPYITLKWAQSADGYMSARDGSPVRLSTPLTTVLAHRQRALHDAILVGSETMLHDHPRLDTRLWTGRSPKPLVWDRRGRLSAKDLSCVALPPQVCRDADIPSLMARLYSEGTTSVLVEGGASILRSFLEAGIWDKARVETASAATLGAHGGTPAPVPPTQPYKTASIGTNAIRWYANNGIVRVKNL